jgi:hypothetical protein
MQMICISEPEVDLGLTRKQDKALYSNGLHLDHHPS